MRSALLLIGALWMLPGAAFADTASPASAATAQLDATLSRMNAAYKDVTGIRGNFVQTTAGLSYVEPLVQSGVLSLKAPGKMRWDFVTPTKTQYLSDGTSLWVLEPDEQKCTVFSTITGMMQIIYGFLTGSADPREHFRVSAADADETAGAPVKTAIALKLVPLDAMGAIESVRVYLDPATHRVVGVSMLTPFGDRTDTVLSDVVLGAELPDAEFVYTAREGWRTVQGD